MDSEIIIHFTYNSEKKSENTFILDFLGRVRILIKTRLKINFDRFTMKNMSNFIFNRVLISIRTRPYSNLKKSM